MESIPPEIIEHVCSHLSQFDVSQLMKVSKHLFKTCVYLLWAHPKFNPSCSLLKWRQFVDAIVFGRVLYQDANGGDVRYTDIIKTVDDLSLFIGGEDNDATLKRQDSAIDVELTAGPFQPYSLGHALYILMARCNNIKHFRLQVTCENCEHWAFERVLKQVQTLELKMRISDTFIDTYLFPVSSPITCGNLKSIVLTWTEISDEGLCAIANSCPLLERVEMKFTDMKKRSKFQRMVERGTSQHVSDTSINALLTKCPNIKKFNVYKLVKVGPKPFLDALQSEVFAASLEELTLTFGYENGMTTETVVEIMALAKGLKILRLYGGEDEYFTFDRVISEEFVLNLPRICKSLTELIMNDFDFSKKDTFMTCYYGKTENSFMINDLIREFQSQHPDVKFILCENRR